MVGNVHHGHSPSSMAKPLRVYMSTQPSCSFLYTPHKLAWPSQCLVSSNHPQSQSTAIGAPLVKLGSCGLLSLSLISILAGPWSAFDRVGAVLNDPVALPLIRPSSTRGLPHCRSSPTSPELHHRLRSPLGLKVHPSVFP